MEFELSSTIRFYSAFAHIFGCFIEPTKFLLYTVAQETADGHLLWTKPAMMWVPTSSAPLSPSSRCALATHSSPGIFCACGISPYSVPSLYSLPEGHGHGLAVGLLSGPRQHRNSHTDRTNTTASVVTQPAHTYGRPPHPRFCFPQSRLPAVQRPREGDDRPSNRASGLNRSLTPRHDSGVIHLASSCHTGVLPSRFTFFNKKGEDRTIR